MVNVVCFYPTQKVKEIENVLVFIQHIFIQQILFKWTQSRPTVDFHAT